MSDTDETCHRCGAKDPDGTAEITIEPYNDYWFDLCSRCAREVLQFAQGDSNE